MVKDLDTFATWALVVLGVIVLFCWLLYLTMAP